MYLNVLILTTNHSDWLMQWKLSLKESYTFFSLYFSTNIIIKYSACVCIICIFKMDKSIHFLKFLIKYEIPNVLLLLNRIHEPIQPNVHAVIGWNFRAISLDCQDTCNTKSEILLYRFSQKDIFWWLLTFTQCNQSKEIVNH